MVKTKNQILEEKLKNQLDLKYSAASKLLKEARRNLEIGPDVELDQAGEEELLDEAIIIYEDDLTPEEQEAMKQGNPNSVPDISAIQEETGGAEPGASGGDGAEPEWRRKARLAAERREKQWEREQEQKRLQQQQEAAAKAAPPPPPGATTDSQLVEAQPQATDAMDQGEIDDDPDMQPVVRITRTVKTKGKVSSNKKPGEVSYCYCVIL